MQPSEKDVFVEGCGRRKANHKSGRPLNAEALHFDQPSAPSGLRIGVESEAENVGTYLSQGGSNEQEVYRTVVRC